MNSFSLKHVIREPRAGSREGAPALLLLHGVGSNEQDLLGLAPALDERLFIVSARAPITRAPGSYAWYPIEFTPTGFIIDPTEAERSRQIILRFASELTSAYNIERLFIGGFSQGAIMSIAAALSSPKQFAGAVGMSGRLLSDLDGSIAPAAELEGFPIMLVHGTYDEVIPVDQGRELRDRLQHLPVALTYREFNMAHHVTPESISDIAAWLKERIDGRTIA